MFTSKTPIHKDAKGNPIEGSIATIEQVKIAGMKQTIMIRGRDVNNPILLFLHGGPGRAQIGFARHYQTELEKHFVVVNWDQRGAGKSYSKKTRNASMNLEQFILDTHELVQLLCERFGQKKIFVVGHSWGSIVGVLYAKRYPDYVHAYIGVGQIINPELSEMISYQLVLIYGRQIEHRRAIKALNKIGYPPYSNTKDLMVHRKWLTKFGGFIRNGSFYKILSKGLLSTEYTINDWLNYRKGREFSIKNLGPEMMRINLIEQTPSLDVPAYFCVGRYDYQSPSELQEQYYNHLDAPQKDLVWFENSAHAPHFEEPNTFLIQCLRIKDEIFSPKRLKRSLLYI